MAFSIIALFFPAVLLAGGAYLAMRGLARYALSAPGSSSGTHLSGIASSKTPFSSHVSEQPCVYSRMVVEYYAGGTVPWRQAVVVEKNVPFMLGGKLVDPSHAAFQVSNMRIYKGYARTEGGLLETFQKFRDNSSAARIARDVLEYTGVVHGEVGRDDVLDAKVVSAVVRHGGEQAKKHIHSALRVQEYLVPVGSALDIVGMDKPSQQGNQLVLAGDVAVSDSGEEAARHYFKEKGYLGIALGALLVLASVVLFFILLM